MKTRLNRLRLPADVEFKSHLLVVGHGNTMVRLAFRALDDVAALEALQQAYVGTSSACRWVLPRASSQGGSFRYGRINIICINPHALFD